MEAISTDRITLAGVVGIIAFLWKVSRDLSRDISGLRERFDAVLREIAVLRERMAKLEGLFEGFTGYRDAR